MIPPRIDVSFSPPNTVDQFKGITDRWELDFWRKSFERRSMESTLSKMRNMVTVFFCVLLSLVLIIDILTGKIWLSF